jgi:hypothetical protein
MAGPLFKKTFEGIPLGILVRKDIGEITIFRVRRGNGYYGAKLGKIYQDKYNYFIPPSINNPEGEPYRTALAQAVLNWQTIISDDQKAEYNHRASRDNMMSGYNLYISEYIKANT